MLPISPQAKQKSSCEKGFLSGQPSSAIISNARLNFAITSSIGSSARSPQIVRPTDATTSPSRTTTLPPPSSREVVCCDGHVGRVRPNDDYVFANGVCGRCDCATLQLEIPGQSQGPYPCPYRSGRSSRVVARPSMSAGDVPPTTGKCARRSSVSRLPSVTPITRTSIFGRSVPTLNVSSSAVTG